MLKLLSLFSGIGAFEKALDNLEVPFDLVGYCEFDKYASKSYSAIHKVDESKNLGDITKVDETKLPTDIDILTYGFPCQDISLAGKQQGLFNDDGTQTRSGLFFEALRIIEHCQPKIAIAENVKNLTSKKFNAQFQVVLASLEAAGYNNYWKVLNAKDYGIPQNRERVFIVSIRKDIDTGIFEFPEGFPLEKRLKDVLEEVVDDKYYLSDKALEKMTMNPTDAGKHFIDIIGHSGTGGQKGWIHIVNGGIGALSATDYKQPKQIAVKQLAQIYPNSGNPQAGRIYDTDGISPTMDTCSGGNRMPKVFVREATKQGYAEAYEGDPINLEQPNSTTRRGRVGHGVAQTLTTSPAQAVVEPKIEVVGNYSPSGHDASRIVDENGIAPTVKENHGTVTAVAMRGRYNATGEVEQHIEVSDREYANAITTVQKDSLVGEPTIQKVDIPQVVKVRKYPVDTERLVHVLRDQKQKCGWTNKELAEELELPLTTVEHWFRRDNCFAIPEPDVWEDLKYLLEMDDIKEFDESIMTFEEKEGVFEKSERHYMSDGIAPTLTSGSAAEKVIEPTLRIRKLTPKECFRLMGFDDESFHRAEAVNSNTQLYKQAGNSIVVDVLEELFCMMLDENGNLYV